MASFRTASKLSKIKSTVGQVLNPVVLTTFCFHSIIFCFGVVLMEQAATEWLCWLLVGVLVVDELAILVL